MGALVDQISRLDQTVYLNENRAERIESDVCRRLGIDVVGRHPRELLVTVSKIKGGRRMVEVIEVRDHADREPLASYGVKQAEGAEAGHAIRASELGIGPFILDVSEEGIILEEFLPERFNIRRRSPSDEESDSFGSYLSELFLTFMIPDENRLIYHRDERADHIFLLGPDGDIRVKLIDWGRAATWPMERFTEWGMEQLFWYYGQLTFGRPAVWSAFVNSLVEAFPPDPGGEALADAYMLLVRYQISTLRDALHRSSGVRFLEFLVECGRVDIDLEPLNEFVEKHADLRGDDLAHACCDSLE